MTVYDPDAEAALLGVMLTDAKALAGALPNLTEDDFTNDLHRSVYKRMVVLTDRDESVDVTTVTARSKLNKLAVRDLSVSFGVPAAWPSYLKQVQEATLMRGQALVLTEARELLLAGELEAANERLATLPSAVMVGVDETWDPAALASMMLDRYERVMGGEQVYGIPCGFPSLDDQYGPFLRFGGATILFGPEGAGKTVIATNVMKFVLESGKRVLYLTLEADQPEVFDAFARIIGKLDGRRVVSAQLTDDDMRRWMAALEDLVGYEDRLDVWTPQTYGSIPVSTIEARARDHHADLVVIDHVQLLAHSEDKRSFELAAISRNLKVMAERLHVPLLLLSAVNKQSHMRGGLGSVPDAMDLRDSGMLGHDAVNVVGIQQPDDGHLRLHGTKARYGKRRGIVSLKWIPATGECYDDGPWDAALMDADLSGNGHRKPASVGGEDPRYR